MTWRIQSLTPSIPNNNNCIATNHSQLNLCHCVTFYCLDSSFSQKKNAILVEDGNLLWNIFVWGWDCWLQRPHNSIWICLPKFIRCKKRIHHTIHQFLYDFGQIIGTKPPSSHPKWWFSKGNTPQKMPKQLRFTNHVGHLVRNFPYEFQSASIFARRLDTAKKLSNLYNVYKLQGCFFFGVTLWGAGCCLSEDF